MPASSCRSDIEATAGGGLGLRLHCRAFAAVQHSIHYRSPVLPIVFPRDWRGTWLTATHLVFSVTALLLAWLTDLPLAPLAAALGALGGLMAAGRLLLQRAFTDGWS